MAILEQEVFVGLGGGNGKHFESLGYEIPKYKDKQGNLKIKKGTKMLVRVEDLPDGSNVKVTKICDEINCGKHTTNITYSSILSQRKKTNGTDRCQKCAIVYANKILKENIPYERSLEYFAKENNKGYLLEEYSSKNTLPPEKIFRASNDSYFWNCNKCGSEFTQNANTRTCYGCGCPYCSGMKVNETNSLLSINPEIATEWHPTKNGDLTPSGIHYYSNKYVWWKCIEGHEWEAIVETRTQRNYGCPTCAEPKGEKRIRKWLKENGISFIPQNEFNGLIGIGGGNLSYDFYLPEHNLLIEYQGEFHDGKVNDYVKQNLEHQQEHDKRKKKYADQNRIKLLEIWYWDYENIEEILVSILVDK